MLTFYLLASFFSRKKKDNKHILYILIKSSGATVALHKLNGVLIGTKNVVVRLAKNINYVRI